MDINFLCSTKRKELGKPCVFSDVGPIFTLEIDPDPKQRELFSVLPTIDRGTDKSTKMCTHEVNTLTYPTESRGMNHIEGGWPATVDFDDEDTMMRFRKKVEKDKNCINSVKSLADFVETFVMENNSIDIYENYFDGELIDKVEDFSLTNAGVFNDLIGDYRSVVDISWTMDSKKFAAAYSLKQSDEYPVNGCLNSYVWDSQNNISPVYTLKPEAYISCIECSPTNGNFVLTGYISGQVALWDIRVSGRSQQLSDALNSHKGKVTGVKWIDRKNEMLFFSASSDGQIISWDARKLSSPKEIVKLEENSADVLNIDQNYTVSCVEYDITVSDQFMVGTDQGVVLSFNRKYVGKNKTLKSKYNCSGGPLLAIERNAFFPQLFATCDSLSSKIWSDTVVDTPILNIISADGYFTDVTWSPTRASTFYATKTTGFLEVWDIPGKNKNPLTKLKVSDECLLTAAVSGSGGHIACGTLSGSIQLLNIPQYLRCCSDLEIDLVKECVRNCETVVGGKRREERISDIEIETHPLAIREDLSDPPEEAKDLYEENKLLFYTIPTDNASSVDNEGREEDSVETSSDYDERVSPNFYKPVSDESLVTGNEESSSNEDEDISQDIKEVASNNEKSTSLLDEETSSDYDEHVSPNFDKPVSDESLVTGYEEISSNKDEDISQDIKEKTSNNEEVTSLGNKEKSSNDDETTSQDNEETYSNNSEATSKDIEEASLNNDEDTSADDERHL